MTTAVATPVSITCFPPADVYDGELNTEVYGIPRNINADLRVNPEDSTPYTFSNGVVARTNRLYCAVQNNQTCLFQTFEANPTSPLCYAPADADESIKSKRMVRYTAIALQCQINPHSERAQKITLAQDPRLMTRRTLLIRLAIRPCRIIPELCELISAYAHESPAAIAHDCMLDIFMGAESTSAQANKALRDHVYIRMSCLLALSGDYSLLTNRLLRWPRLQQRQPSSSGSAGGGGAAAATSTSSMPFHHVTLGCCVFNENLNVITRSGAPYFKDASFANPSLGAPASAAAAAST